MAGGGVFAFTVVGRAGRLGTSPLSKRFGGSYTSSGSGKTEGAGHNLYLSEFGNIDKSGEVFEVRTFVIEFAEIIMLGRESASQRFECVVVVGPFGGSIIRLSHLGSAG